MTAVFTDRCGPANPYYLCVSGGGLEPPTCTPPFRRVASLPTELSGHICSLLAAGEPSWTDRNSLPISRYSEWIPFYATCWSPKRDLNPQSTAYKAVALPFGYPGTFSRRGRGVSLYHFSRIYYSVLAIINQIRFKGFFIIGSQYVFPAVRHNREAVIPENIRHVVGLFSL